MNSTAAVSNASPLIALEQIGRLELLEQFFGTVLVPPAVVREVSPPLIVPQWISERQLAQPIAPIILSASLGPGESETIGLALEVNADWVILDDRPARRLAEAVGLPVIGTLGVLLAAKQRGLISVLKDDVDALIQYGFRVSGDLYTRVLTDAGEGP